LVWLFCLCSFQILALTKGYGISCL
jgi:hypothetical protein